MTTPSDAEQIASLRAALETLNGARDAWTNLTTHQTQLDADGCMVGVSRQAVDETVDAILKAADILLAATAQPAAGEPGNAFDESQAQEPRPKGCDHPMGAQGGPASSAPHATTEPSEVEAVANAVERMCYGWARSTVEAVVSAALAASRAW